MTRIAGHMPAALTLCLISTPALSGPQAVETRIWIDNVPEQLRLPLPDGANYVLKVRVHGAEPRAVWLAADEAAGVADSRVPLSPVEQEGHYQINLADPRVLEVLRGQGRGQFHVVAETASGTRVFSLPVAYAMTGRSGLDFPWDDASLTVYQRTSRDLGGSPRLALRLGDITRGEVVTTIAREDGTFLLAPTPWREGDTRTLSVGTDAYHLTLERLVNLPIGDDYAVFRLHSAAKWETSQIDGLLKDIEQSGLTFIRNGEDLSAEVFAGLLRLKHQHANPRPATAADFIRLIATRSSTTGEPYLVRLPSGGDVPLATWLSEKTAAKAAPQ